MVKRSEEFTNAVKAGNRAVIEQMLDQNPRLANLRIPEGISVVLLAIYSSEWEIAELLVDRGATLDIFDAAALGAQEQLQSLLDTDPTLINTWSRDGFQPLGLAAFFGHREIVALLLDRGAEINTPSQNDRRATPLHLAVAEQHLEITRLLLDRGADPNALQEDDFSALHEAAQTGHPEMVELLLQHGADPQIQNISGRTPEALAQEMGYSAIAVRLHTNE